MDKYVINSLTKFLVFSSKNNEWFELLNDELLNLESYFKNDIIGNTYYNKMKYITDCIYFKKNRSEYEESFQQIKTLYKVLTNKEFILKEHYKS